MKSHAGRYIIKYTPQELKSTVVTTIKYTPQELKSTVVTTIKYTPQKLKSTLVTTIKYTPQKLKSTLVTTIKYTSKTKVYSSNYHKIYTSKTKVYCSNYYKIYTSTQLQANWIGNVLRRNCLLKHTSQEKTEGTRIRGRRGKQLLDDLNWKIMEIEEEALDCTL